MQVLMYLLLYIKHRGLQLITPDKISVRKLNNIRTWDTFIYPIDERYSFLIQGTLSPFIAEYIPDKLSPVRLRIFKKTGKIVHYMVCLIYKKQL